MVRNYSSALDYCKFNVKNWVADYLGKNALQMSGWLMVNMMTQFFLVNWRCHVGDEVHID